MELIAIGLNVGLNCVQVALVTLVVEIKTNAGPGSSASTAAVALCGDTLLSYSIVVLGVGKSFVNNGTGSVDSCSCKSERHSE